MADSIYQQVSAEVKTAMKSRDRDRLAALRLIMSEFKNVEVNERIELDDARILQILDKMTKQRKDSHQQFADAGRDDLADREALEISIIAEFLPSQLSDDELTRIVDDAVSEVGAASMRDMGRVMGIVKPRVQGRADMGAVSGLVRAKLS